MGLDMYIEKNYDFFYNEASATINLGDGGGIVIPRIESAKEEAMYWRKAHHIHNWFVKNVQDGVDDCREYVVLKEDFEKLLNDINSILKIKDKKERAVIAGGIFPLSDGIFFGNNIVHEYYWDYLEYTKVGVKKILADMERHESEDPRYDIYYTYQSSW